VVVGIERASRVGVSYQSVRKIAAETIATGSGNGPECAVAKGPAGELESRL
jgi:hypothetical protein